MVKTPATDKWVENRDYELVPGDDNFWKVRILTGDLIETVFQYGAIKFDDTDYVVTFDYQLVYSPDESLEHQDPELQKATSGILHSLLLRLLDEDTDGHRTDNHSKRNK